MNKTAATPINLSTGHALLVAWGTTLLLSRLPEIVLREVVGWDVPWINIFWIVVAAGLIVAASVVPLMRPLRAYFVVMLTVLVLTTVVDPLIRGALFGDIAPAGTDPQLRRLFAERVLLVLEALAIIPVLAALGYRGGEAYLALGKLRAPIGPAHRATGPVVGRGRTDRRHPPRRGHCGVRQLDGEANRRSVVTGSAVASDRLAGGGMQRVRRGGSVSGWAARTAGPSCRAEGRYLDPRGLVRSRPRLRGHPIRSDGVRHGRLARAALREGDDRHPRTWRALGAPLQRRRRDLHIPCRRRSCRHALTTAGCAAHQHSVPIGPLVALGSCQTMDPTRLTAEADDDLVQWVSADRLAGLPIHR